MVEDNQRQSKSIEIDLENRKWSWLNGSLILESLELNYEYLVQDSPQTEDRQISQTERLAQS